MRVMRILLALGSIACGGCRGQPTSFPEPLAGLDVKLEAVQGGPATLPGALQLVVHNPGDRPARFIAPGPMCAEVTEGDRKVRYPLLAAVFHDAEGREGDTSFGPVFLDRETRRPQAPEEVTIGPRSAWRREYPTSAFWFVGPCGPAANLEELFQPGDVQLKLALEILEFPPAPAAGPALEGEIVPPLEPVRRRTNQIAVRVREQPGVFHRFTDRYQADRLDFFDREETAPVGIEVTKEQIPEILRAFDSPGFDDHILAAHMLRDLGPRGEAAVPRLIVLLGSKMYGDRVLATLVLGAIGPAASAAVPALENARQDPHPHVRQEATEALARVKGEPPPEALDPATGEPVVQGQPLRYWVERMSMGSNRAHHMLEKLGSKAVPRLLEALKDDHATRFPAIAILRNLDEPAGLELVARALEDDDVRVRRGAAEALAPSESGPSANRRHQEPVVLLLVAALGDADAEVRRHTARALSRAEGSATAAALARALAEDPDREVRAAAARSLSTSGVGSPEALEALRAAARHGPATIRDAAVASLAALGERAPPAEDPAAALRERAERDPAIEEKEASYAQVVRAPGEPEAVFFVLANGGSNQPQLPRTKELVIRMIESLPPEAVFGVFFYSALLAKYPADGKPARAERNAKEDGVEFIRSMPPGGGSCAHLGFEAAFDMIDASTARRSIIVYAGNGFATCPGKVRATYEKECLEEIARRNRGRAAVHSFASGEFNASFLRLLPAMNGGAFTRLRD